MIIVSGANGQLGRMVVERLLTRVPAEQVGVSVRDPEKAAGLGVRVRRGDFTDPASLADAFEGASRVLVVSVDKLGDEAVQQHVAAIEAAAAAGAERIVYTSHMGARPDSPFAPGPDHAATEAALAATGVPFTVLRNGFYASSALPLLAGARETGELVAPEDGPIAWTAHADLAEAAAIALTDDRLSGVTPPLTAAKALDMADVAAILSRLSGRTVKRVVVSDDEYHDRLVSHGVPEFAAPMLVALFAASRLGHFGPADATLEGLLDHPTIPLVDILTAAGM
jgi:NAD(P)H dehydrogenase (quinone)